MGRGQIAAFGLGDVRIVDPYDVPSGRKGRREIAEPQVKCMPIEWPEAIGRGDDEENLHEFDTVCLAMRGTTDESRPRIRRAHARFPRAAPFHPHRTFGKTHVVRVALSAMDPASVKADVLDQ